LDGNGAPARGFASAGLLRFATVGSVDDGKSTLIGRLLLDANQVPDDQLAHVEEASARRGDGYVNLALLTDGLRAEREQGITIDVAYRYFRTARRRFIIADTPGHEQYTRNMVTGASTADLSVILVDARHGVLEQSKRHAYVSALLGVPHLVVCVNKMDLVDFDQDRFDSIKREIEAICEKLDFNDVLVVPMSALHGDNVVDRSERMPWYTGPALLPYLEVVEPESNRNFRAARFPVQWVVRPMSDQHHDYRAYAGQVASGILRPGDEVAVLPSGVTSRIEAITTSDGELEEAFPPMSVSVRLSDRLDVSRGDVICDAASPPAPARELQADVCWMSKRSLQPGDRFLLRAGAAGVKAVVGELEWVLDVHTLDPAPVSGSLELNDIGRIVVRTAAPVVCDTYRENRATGCFILVDEASGDTVAAGMVTEARA
jgi:sulfate adenylyltransferase large subunit